RIVVVQRLAIAAQSQTKVGAIVERLKRFGCERKRRIIARERLVETAETAQRIASVVEKHGTSRIDLKRAVVTCKRLGVALEIQKHRTAIDKRAHMIGRNGECAVIARQRLFAA